MKLRTGIVISGVLLAFGLMSGAAKGDGIPCVSPNGTAATCFDYTATDVTPVKTPTSWENDWTFKGASTFTATILGEPFVIDGLSGFAMRPPTFGSGTSPAGFGFAHEINLEIGFSRGRIPYCFECAPAGMENVWSLQVGVGSFEDGAFDSPVFANLNPIETLPLGDPPPGDPAPTSTPEPSSMLLMGSGLVGLGFMAKRKISQR